MTLQQKFNEYIASGDPIIGISDEQRDWILPFIERCVGEEREQRNTKLKQAIWTYKSYFNPIDDAFNQGKHQACDDIFTLLTQEYKIK